MGILRVVVRYPAGVRATGTVSYTPGVCQGLERPWNHRCADRGPTVRCVAMAPRLSSFAAVALVAAVCAAGADAATFKVSISGQQEVSWAVDGTTGTCELRQGSGSGRATFRFASSRPAFTSLNPSGGGASLIVSVPSQATGSIEGSFTDSVAAPCPGFEPRDPVVQPTAGCGSTRFGLRVDAQLRGKVLFVTGVSTPPADVGADCPFPVGGFIDDSNDRSACGEGSQQWERSWGVSSAGGAGLLASRITVKRSALTRRTVRLARTETIACTIGSSYSGGVKLTGKLRYVLTLRRTG